MKFAEARESYVFGQKLKALRRNLAHVLETSSPAWRGAHALEVIKQAQDMIRERYDGDIDKKDIVPTKNEIQLFNIIASEVVDGIQSANQDRPLFLARVVGENVEGDGLISRPVLNDSLKPIF